MIVPRERWRVVSAVEPGAPPFVNLELACHVVAIRATWVDANGVVNRGARITCTEQFCRKDYEGLVLEGWGP